MRIDRLRVESVKDRIVETLRETAYGCVPKTYFSSFTSLKTLLRALGELEKEGKVELRKWKNATMVILAERRKEALDYLSYLDANGRAVGRDYFGSKMLRSKTLPQYYSTTAEVVKSRLDVMKDRIMEMLEESDGGYLLMSDVRRLHSDYYLVKDAVRELEREMKVYTFTFGKAIYICKFGNAVEVQKRLEEERKKRENERKERRRAYMREYMRKRREREEVPRVSLSQNGGYWEYLVERSLFGVAPVESPYLL